jgi:hypothetical protein
VRRRRRRQSEEQLHHLLHLRLLRAAVADHGALHFGGRVFSDVRAALHRGEHRHAARMPQLQRAPDVEGVEQVLDRHAIRPALGEKRRQAAVNLVQFVGERRGRRRGNGATEHNRETRTVGFDAAVAGARRPRIDPEHSHASDASISFAEMSKFDQTCCTSS